MVTMDVCHRSAEDVMTNHGVPAFHQDNKMLCHKILIVLSVVLRDNSQCFLSWETIACRSCHLSEHHEHATPFRMAHRMTAHHKPLVPHYKCV